MNAYSKVSLPESARIDTAGQLRSFDGQGSRSYTYY